MYDVKVERDWVKKTASSEIRIWNKVYQGNKGARQSRHVSVVSTRYDRASWRHDSAAYSAYTTTYHRIRAAVATGETIDRTLQINICNNNVQLDHFSKTLVLRYLLEMEMYFKTNNTGKVYLRIMHFL